MSTDTATLVAPTENAPEQPEAAKRKLGRPRKFASWFPAVAKTMRDGTTLRMALIWNRITLDARGMRKLYRNREFRRLYRIERQLYMLSDYGKRPLTDEQKFRRAIERQIQ